MRPCTECGAYFKARGEIVAQEVTRVAFRRGLDPAALMTLYRGSVHRRHALHGQSLQVGPALLEEEREHRRRMGAGVAARANRWQRDQEQHADKAR